MPLVGEPAWPPSVLYCNDNGFLQLKLYSEETLPHSGFFSPLLLTSLRQVKGSLARPGRWLSVLFEGVAEPAQTGVLSFLSASLSTTPNPELARG